MAAFNVFDTNQQFTGSFNIGDNRVRFGGLSADYLVQSINYNYAQQITMIYQLGAPVVAAANGLRAPSNVYYAGGRAQGSASLTRVVGGKSTNGDEMLAKYNDICNPQNIEIEQLSGLCLPRASESSNIGGGMTTILHDAVLVSLAGGSEVSSPVISEQMGFMFLRMSRNSN